MRKCTVEGCERETHGRKMCLLHYQQQPWFRAKRIEYMKKYNYLPEVVERRKLRDQDPVIKEKRRQRAKERYRDPKIRAKIKAWQKLYFQKEGVKARLKEKRRAYHSKPYIKFREEEQARERCRKQLDSIMSEEEKVFFDRITGYTENEAEQIFKQFRITTRAHAKEGLI